MRLDKLMEKQLQLSRKEMKRLFLRGKVKIDSQIVYQENKNVDSRIHEIEIDGKQLTTDERYYLLNKPQGVVTANTDYEHQTVFALLAEQDTHEDLYAVGRLDRDTSGLLLLTTNGQLGYDLLHPTKKVVKVYEAWVNETVTTEDISAFSKGIIFLDGTSCQPAQLEIEVIQDGNTKVRLAIQEGKFHQVKKMFLARGKKVISLKRLSMGPLTLGELAEGAYRPLEDSELLSLKDYFR